MNLFGQLPVKGMGHHKVCKTVIEHVNVDSALSRGVQGVDEALAYLIVFPDVRFHQHSGLGSIDRIDHIVIELITIGVDREIRMIEFGMKSARMRGAPPFTVSMDKPVHAD